MHTGLHSGLHCIALTNNDTNKGRFKVISLEVLEDFGVFFFYIWAWQLSGLCNQDFLKQKSFTLSKDYSYKL